MILYSYPIRRHCCFFFKLIFYLYELIQCLSVCWVCYYSLLQHNITNLFIATKLKLHLTNSWNIIWFFNLTKIPLTLLVIVGSVMSHYFQQLQCPHLNSVNFTRTTKSEALNKWDWFSKVVIKQICMIIYVHSNRLR